MKRIRTFLLISMSLLVLLACSLGGAKATEEPPVVLEIPTLAALPQEAPTLPPPPPVEETVAEAQPEVPEPTPTEVSFDAASATWKEFVTAGDKSREFSFQMGRRVVFELPSAETYSYVFAEDVSFGDVYVETEVETVKADRNGIALICRHSDRGWYELRIATRGIETGSYQLYRYDPDLLARKQVPYVNLLKNMTKVNTPDIINGLLKINTLGFSCKGEELRVFINGVEQLPPDKRVVTDNRLKEGSVGMGAMSFGNGPVQIEFLLDSYTATE